MPISQCVKNICLCIRRLRLPQSCYHPWTEKVLDEAICTGPSPSHDIRPPWRPSVLQKVEVCRGKYNSIYTDCWEWNWVKRYYRIWAQGSFSSYWSSPPPHALHEAFWSIQPASYLVLFEIGKSGEFGFGCPAHLVCADSYGDGGWDLWGSA